MNTIGQSEDGRHEVPTAQYNPVAAYNTAMQEAADLWRQCTLYHRTQLDIRITHTEVWEALRKKPNMPIPYGHALDAIDPKDLQVGNIIIIRTDPSATLAEEI